MTVKVNYTIQLEMKWMQYFVDEEISGITMDMPVFNDSDKPYFHG